jgi:hypothetical protein
VAHLSQEVFIESWQNASSITHASVTLQKNGHKHMTPLQNPAWGRCLRTFGVRLKRMPRPSFR